MKLTKDKRHVAEKRGEVLGILVLELNLGLGWGEGVHLFKSAMDSLKKKQAKNSFVFRVLKVPP